MALLIGFAFYTLLLHPRVRGILWASISRLQALTIGAGIFILVFLSVYFGSLDGFYQMDVRKNGEEILLGYILPRRTLILTRKEIAEVKRVPSFKGRRQLVLYSSSGTPFASARAAYPEVRRAFERVNYFLNLAPKQD
jgi:hypothetical protein